MNTEFAGRAYWFSPWLRFGIWLFPGLTAVLAIFFPKWSSVDVQRYGLTAAFVLAGACAAFEVWRRRHRPPDRSPSHAAPLETSLLRSFLPFERGDTLIGRRDDIADALAVLQASEFRFGVIWGESGCGKTSFLRAGLVPALADKGHHAVYLGRPTADPAGALAQAVHGADGSARVYVIVDQFEEYFLTVADQQRTLFLGTQIQALLDAHPRCALVLAIRRDFFARLQHLAPAVPDPTAPRTTFELANLRTAAARDVLTQAAAGEAVQFEAALVDAVIDDLEADGAVWPVELQLLGTRLKRMRVRQKSVYVALGRKAGVIGTFIHDEVARLPKPVLGEIVLRKLCAPGAIAKSPVDISYAELEQDVRQRDPALLAGTELATCLKMLQQAWVVVQTGADTFNLAHDALAPLIEQGTTGLQGQAELAERSISFYLGAFRHDRTVRIPLRTLWQVRRHGNRTTLADSQVRQLVWKSWRHAWFTVTWPAAVVLVVLVGAGYAIAFSSWSIGTTRSSRVPGPLSIAILSGNPYTRFLPGSERVIAETAVRVDQLDAANPDAVNRLLRGENWAFGSPRYAIRPIAGVLPPTQQLAFLRLAGQPQAAAATFVDKMAHGALNGYQKKEGADAIGLVGRPGDAAATVAVAAKLSKAMSASRSLRLPIDQALALGLLQLAQYQGGLPGPAQSGLAQAVAAMRTELEARRFAGLDDAEGKLHLVAATIEQDLTNGVTAPTAHDLSVFAALLDAYPDDAWGSLNGASLLARCAHRNADLAAPALHDLLRLATADFPEDALRHAKTLQAFAGLATSYPVAAQRPPIQRSLIAALEPEGKWIEDSALLLSGVGRAAPGVLPGVFAATLQARAGNPATTPALRAVATLALARLAIAEPALRDEAGKRRLFDLLQPQRPAGTQGERSIQEAAMRVAAEVAAAGQLDDTSVQAALRVLGRPTVSRGRPGIGFGMQDSDLVAHRLGSAGGRVDAQFLAMIIATFKEGTTTARDAAARVLVVAAGIAPAEILKKETALDAVVLPSTLDGNTRRHLRPLVLAAYGRADALTGSAQQRDTRCKALLADGANAEAWQRGAYCAYFAALDQPATLPAWSSYLQDLSRQDVASTMAGHMALEMLVNVRRIAEAKSDPARADLVISRMRYDLDHHEAHVGIAARAAMLALGVDRP